MADRRISTVLMLDVVGSTHIAAELGDARYRELSRRFDQLVRSSLKRFGGKEEDHAGDVGRSPLSAQKRQRTLDRWVNPRHLGTS